MGAASVVRHEQRGRYHFSFHLLPFSVGLVDNCLGYRISAERGVQILDGNLSNCQACGFLAANPVCTEHHAPSRSAR